MEQNYRKTSLSVGETIRALLLGDATVASLTGRVIPVAVAPDTQLPYIVYRRTDIATTQTKSGYVAADGVMIELLCCAGSYADSVELAEAARYAIERRQPQPPGCVHIRGGALASSEELYEGDAYIQSLVFKILT